MPLSEDEEIRVWQAIERNNINTVQNGVKLDTAVSVLAEIKHELFGNGQPGMRARLTRAETQFENCRLAHERQMEELHRLIRAEREEWKRENQVSKTVKTMIGVAIGTGVINIAIAAFHLLRA